MKNLYKKASHIRAHTWKDIGGIGGLVLDGIFFVFLLVVSLVALLVGVVFLVLNYIFSPVLGLLSMRRGSQPKFVDDTVLQEDGTLCAQPASTSEPVKAGPVAASRS